MVKEKKVSAVKSKKTFNLVQYWDCYKMKWVGIFQKMLLAVMYCWLLQKIKDGNNNLVVLIYSTTSGIFIYIWCISICYGINVSYIQQSFKVNTLYKLNGISVQTFWWCLHSFIDKKMKLLFDKIPTNILVTFVPNNPFTMIRASTVACFGVFDV